MCIYRKSMLELIWIYLLYVRRLKRGNIKINEENYTFSQGHSTDILLQFWFSQSDSHWQATTENEYSLSLSSDKHKGTNMQKKGKIWSKSTEKNSTKIMPRSIKDYMMKDQQLREQIIKCFERGEKPIYSRFEI